MPDQQSYQQQNRNTLQHTANMAAIFIQGTARLWDIQMAVTRNFLRYQSQNARMLGLPTPDWSKILREHDGGAHFFEQTADTTINYLRQASEAMNDIQHQLGDLWEQQSKQLAEQTRQQLEQSKSLLRQGADETRRMLEDSGHEAQQAMKEEAQRRPPSPEDQHQPQHQARPHTTDKPEHRGPEPLRAANEDQGNKREEKPKQQAHR